MFLFDLGLQIYAEGGVMLKGVHFFGLCWPCFTQLFLMTSMLNVVCKAWVFHRLCENGIMMVYDSHGHEGLFRDRIFLLILAGNLCVMCSAGIVLGDARGMLTVLGNTLLLMGLYLEFVINSEDYLPSVTSFARQPEYCQEMLCVSEATIIDAARDMDQGQTSFASLSGLVRDRHATMGGEGRDGPDRSRAFWCMRFMGVAPVSASFSGPIRAGLGFVDVADRMFALRVNGWKALFLVLLCGVHCKGLSDSGVELRWPQAFCTLFGVFMFAETLFYMLRAPG